MQSQAINKLPSIIKQALTVNKSPFPWLKAFLAGAAAGLPIFIGLLFDNLHYGLIAGLGGFTFLYVFPIPYAQLAKKLTWCVLAITACVFLGTLLAPHPIIVAIMMGLIGATAIFLFGAFRLAGPSALFFVLIFAMASGMSIAPEEAFIRAFLAFLGGLLSFVLAMSRWIFNPYGPEKNIIKRTYNVLADYIESIGTDLESEKQQTVLVTLKEASQILASGYIRWRKNDLFTHLYVLNTYANKIFLYATEELHGKKVAIPIEISESLRMISRLVDSKNLKDDALVELPHPEVMDEIIAKLYMEINEAKGSLTVSSSSLNNQVQIKSISPKRIILGAFDKNSIVFINALRFGFFTILAAIIAYEFEFNRSFWIPLSCVAVMSGATTVATLHRAIQRSLGTVFGIIIASAILTFHPSGFIIALLIFLLTFITELFIVKNYGLAALFFTPSALIMAEAGSTGEYSFMFFASARLIDVFIGIFIGLIGVWFVGRKSASSRLPHLISRTIRSQAQVLFSLFSEQGFHQSYSKDNIFNKMETNITNLTLIYDTATGEIPKDKKSLEYYWPIVYSIQELGYLLEKCGKMENRPVLNGEKLGQLLFVFETMSNAADQKISAKKKDIPEIPGFQSIQDTIGDLQKSISNYITNS
ncbi:putative membrane protein YvaC [Lysinibacillus sp. PLM2]|nr:putative membrane protein YvaC [Lysinibacillus sp. PLM2]